MYTVRYCGLLLQKGEVSHRQGPYGENGGCALKPPARRQALPENTVCTTCGTLIKTGEVVLSAKGHTLELRNGKQPTCTETGYTGDHYRVSGNQVIVVTGHVLQMLWAMTGARGSTPRRTAVPKLAKRPASVHAGQLKQTREIEILPCPSQDFEDLDRTAWYLMKAFDFVLNDHGLMIGMSDNGFLP